MITKQLSKTIQRMLFNQERLRDSDELLIATLWRNEFPDCHEISAYVMLGRIARGEVSSPESIRRCRQKIQEEIPELRGHKYNKRHNYQEPWKQQVRELESPLQERLL